MRSRTQKKHFQRQYAHAIHKRATTSSSFSLRVLRKSSATGAKVTVLIVIVLVMVTVSISAWLVNYLEPKKVAKRDLEAIVTDFYVNDFYRQSAETASKPLSEVLSRYREHGLAAMPLRRLLIYAQDKDPNKVQNIRNFCNENTSSVRYFPFEPYGENDFTVEYHYDCDFDS